MKHWLLVLFLACSFSLSAQVADTSEAEREEIKKEALEMRARINSFLNQQTARDKNGNAITQRNYDSLVQLVQQQDAKLKEVQNRLKKLSLIAGKDLPPDVEVYFVTNSYELKPKQLAKLDSLGSALRKIPGVVLKLEGQADERGNMDQNFTLSRKRAAAIKEYLVTSHGMDENNIRIESFGSIKSDISSNANEANARSRKVNIWVILPE